MKRNLVFYDKFFYRGWLNIIKLLVLLVQVNISFQCLGRNDNILSPQIKNINLGGKINFKTISTKNGLNSNAISAIFKDSKGFIWIGTYGNGLNRYDGSSFVNYNEADGLAKNTIRCIHGDGFGNIWIGTDGGGVSKFDGISFITYTMANGLSSNHIWTIVEDKFNNLWFGTSNGGYCVLNNNKFECFNITNYTANNDNTVRSIVHSNDGTIWLGTDKSGLIHIGKDKINIYNESNLISHNTIRTLFQDSKNRLWIGTDGGGVDIYQNGVFSNISANSGLVGNKVWDIDEDRNGAIWLSVYGSGISKISNDLNSIVNISDIEGLDNKYVWCSIIDEFDKHWIGTYGGGLLVYYEDGLIGFDRSNGLTNNVIRSIQSNNNSFFVGTWGSGVFQLKNNKFSKIAKINNKEFHVYSILIDKNDVMWIATWRNGVLRYHDGKLEEISKNKGIKVEDIRSIIEDKDGSIWFATWGDGLLKYQNNKFEIIRTGKSLEENQLWCLTQNKEGNIYFGSNGKGLGIYNKAKVKFLDSKYGLKGDIIFSMTLDNQNNLWLGTDKGLNVASTESLNKTFAEYHHSNSLIFYNFPSKLDFNERYISQVISLDSNTMAIGSFNGLTIFNFFINQKYLKIDLFNIKIFNNSTGYPISDIITGSKTIFAKDSKSIWVSSFNENFPLIRINLSHKNIKYKYPNTIIQKIGINDVYPNWLDLNNIHSITNEFDSSKIILDYDKGHKSEYASFINKVKFDSIIPYYQIPNRITIPYELNRINFKISIKEIIIDQPLEYQYGILTNNNEILWNNVISNGDITLQNLSEGVYWIAFRARYKNYPHNNENEWGEKILYNIKILPPYWRTWYAYLFYITIITTLIFVMILNLKKRIIRIEKDKMRDNELKHAKAIEEAYFNLEKTHEHLKLAQNQLIHAEKMASLGELTAGIAHEIQNPLNFVNNFSDINKELFDELEVEIEKGDKKEIAALIRDLRENETKIMLHGKRADGIVKSMLQHSRTTSAVKELTDINALCDEYLRLAYHGMRAKDKSFTVDYKTELDPHLPKINVMAQDIGRVLLNLINNAFQAVDERAKKEVANFQPQVTVRTHKLPDAVKIVVEDNGTGIPEHVKGKIFQPFFTTKPTGQGAGLGLSLSYDIISKGHGGELTLETVEGQGTTFIVRLPLN